MNVIRPNGRKSPTVIIIERENKKKLRAIRGADFKAARAETGLSRQTLADALGVPHNTIRDWEQGLKIPPAYVKKWYLQEVKKLVRNKK